MNATITRETEASKKLLFSEAPTFNNPTTKPISTRTTGIQVTLPRFDWNSPRIIAKTTPIRKAQAPIAFDPLHPEIWIPIFGP